MSVMKDFFRSFFARRPAATTQMDLDDVIEQIILNWPADRPFRVDDVLKLYPDLQNERRALIEFAIEEFSDRMDADEELTPLEYAERFPSIRSDLLDSLAVDLALTQLTGVFARQPSDADDKVNWPQPGETVANFELIEPIGKGAFSRVFLAGDLEFKNREVAVKFCRNDTHETEALSQLQHSAIGVVLDVREVPDRDLSAISMQMISRTTLDDVIRSVWQPKNRWQAVPRNARGVAAVVAKADLRAAVGQDWGQLSFNDWALRLAIQLSRGLAASHALDFVHCDMKPSNVLVTVEGMPVLIDFNVAFRQDAAQSPANIGGTLPFMAPEQVRAFAGRGFADVGPKTDIFGLGATLYQLLTGRLPFGHSESSEDGIRRLLDHRRQAPPSVRTINSDIDERFEAIVMRCLSYDTAERPASAIDLARELEAIQRTGSVVVPERSSDRRRIAAAVILTASVLAAFNLRPETQPAAAQPVDEAGVQAALKTAFDALDRGDLTVARTGFEKVRTAQPEHEGAKLGLCRTMTRQGQVMEAAKLLDLIEWQGREPQEVLAFRGYQRVWSAYKTDTLTEALNTLEHARKFAPNDPAILANMALCQLRLGRLPAAVALLEHARIQAPEQSQIAILLMRTYANVRAAAGQSETNAFNAAFVEEVAEAKIKTPSEHWEFAAGLATVAKGLANVDAEVATRLSMKSVALFERGCLNSRERNNWSFLKSRLSSDVVKQVAGKFASLENAGPFYSDDTRIYLLDPLANSPFDRTLQADLTSRPARSVAQR